MKKGKEVFKQHSDLALNLCRDFELKLDSIVIDMTSLENHKNSEQSVEEWVKTHKIEDFYFTRESTMSIFAQWIGEGNLGIGKSVATITEEVIELSNKLNIYVDLLPRQARWQADYALLNYMQDSMFTTSISTMISSMDRITNIIEMTPEIIEYNREATLRDIDAQRKKSLQLLINERKAVIDEIKKERVEVISKIIDERKMVLEELKNERVIVLEEIRSLSHDIVVQSSSEIERIVDKILWRLTVLTIIIGVTILLALVFYKKL